MSAQTARVPQRKGPAGAGDRAGAGERSAPNNGSLRERFESLTGLVNPLNLHIAGAAVLAVVCVYLLIRVAVLWQTANSQNADALANQRMLLQTAEIQARPLEGLDVKLARSNDEADQFYRERLPVSYSEIAAQLGALAHKNGVRLTRVQYAPKAVLGVAGTGGAARGETGQKLSEVQMDAALSGDYRSLVTFINGLERSRQFFIVQNISLTGQQTGQVNLRLRVTTYLRGVPVVELEQKVAADQADGAAAQTNATAPADTPATGGTR